MNPWIARMAHWAQTRPDHRAVGQLGSSPVLTYAELWARAEALADTLRALDVGRAPVGVVAGDARTIAVAELGTQLAGGVVAPQPPDLAAEELTRVLRFLEVRCIIGPVAPGITAAVPSCAAVLPDGVTPERRRPDAPRPGYEIPSSWAMFSATSGTTATPKVVVRSAAGHIGFHDRQDWAGSDDVVLSSLSPVSDPWLRFTLIGGGTYISAYGRGHDPRGLAEAVGELKPTMTLAIPWVYNQWASAEDLHGLLRGLRRGVRLGPLPLRDVETLHRQAGFLPLEVYGAMEIGGMHRMHQTWVEGKMDRLGQAAPGLEYRLVRPADGREAGADEPGELWVRGPGLMEGYLKDPELTAAALRDGWYRTGDAVTRDRDGYFRVVGRLKSMISVAGRKVYPEEVERVLLDHPAVSQVAVFAEDDPVRGERVEAAVVLASGHTVTERELRAYCRTRLTAYKVPRVIRLVSSLPTTRFGRIARQLVQKGGTT